MSNEKSDKIMIVALEIMRDQSESKNSARLNISEIAKRAGVSRAWIYKNFGSSMIAIVKSAIDILAPHLTQPVQPFDVWQTTPADWLAHFEKSLEITLKQVQEVPHLFRFYIRARLENSEISEHLALHENRFINQAVRPQIASGADVQKLNSLAEHLTAIRIGLIFTWLTTGRNYEANRKTLKDAIAMAASKLA